MTRRQASYRRERQMPSGRLARQMREARKAAALRQQRKTERFFAERWEILSWRPRRYSYGGGKTLLRKGPRRHEPCDCGSGKKAAKCCMPKPAYEQVSRSKSAKDQASQQKVP